MTTPQSPNLAATSDVQLRLTLAASQVLGEHESQDKALIVDMVESMLGDMIDEGDLQPIVNYVKMYCDVIDNPEEYEVMERVIWERMQADAQ